VKIFAIGTPYLNPRIQDTWELIPDDSMELKMVAPKKWSWDPNRIRVTDNPFISYDFLDCINQDRPDYYLDGAEKLLVDYDPDILFVMCELTQLQTSRILDAAKNLRCKKLIFCWENINPSYGNNNWGLIDGYVGGNFASCKFAQRNKLGDSSILFAPQNGVDTGFFREYEGRKEFEDIGWINILFPNRFTDGKGVEEVIASMREIFRRKYALLPSITFTGFTNDCGRDLTPIIKKFTNEFSGRARMALKRVPYEIMPKIYNNAHIVINNAKDTPYWKEQCGYSPLEAASTGCAIITSDAGSLMDFWGGSGAEIVEQGDNNVEMLIASIDKLIADGAYRKNCAKKCQSHVIDNFSHIKVATKLREFFKGVSK